MKVAFIACFIYIWPLFGYNYASTLDAASYRYYNPPSHDIPELQFYPFKVEKGPLLVLIVTNKGNVQSTRDNSLNVLKQESFKNNTIIKYIEARPHCTLPKLTPKCIYYLLNLSYQFDIIIFSNDFLYFNTLNPYFGDIMKQFISYERPKAFVSADALRASKIPNYFIIPRLTLNILRKSNTLENAFNPETLKQAGCQLVAVDSLCTREIKLSSTNRACDVITSNKWLIADITDQSSKRILKQIYVSKSPEQILHQDFYKEITVIIKTSKYRKRCLQNLLRSISSKYPGIRILVGISDDEAILSQMHIPGLRTLKLGKNVGLSFGRNQLVQHVTTKYTLLVDDDNVLWNGTDLRYMHSFLENNKVDLVGGQYIDIENYFNVQEPYSYNLIFNRLKPDIVRLEYADSFCQRCHKSQITHNFFLARTESLKFSPWRNRVKMSEHELFFLDYERNGFIAFHCENISVLHDKQTRAHSQQYEHNSKRFTSFCPAI